MVIFIKIHLQHTHFSIVGKSRMSDIPAAFDRPILNSVLYIFLTIFWIWSKHPFKTSELSVSPCIIAVWLFPVLCLCVCISHMFSYLKSVHVIGCLFANLLSSLKLLWSKRGLETTKSFIFISRLRFGVPFLLMCHLKFVALIWTHV